MAFEPRAHPPATGGGSQLEVAVLIPCHNEETAIATVVRAFRASLPGASIYVYDNNSTDRTQEIARSEGAIVRSEPWQGKGHVVRRMFGDIEADVYVLVDGDDTYDAAAGPILVDCLVDGQLDMVNAMRADAPDGAYRTGHRFGNRALTGVVAAIFGRHVGDMLSGYRVFSRRFVKSFPALSSGFEVETELTVHALELRMPIAEITTRYRARPEGSVSKLRTVRDGFRVLGTIGYLIKEERPLPVFGLTFMLLAAASVGLAWPVVREFMDTGLVPRLPTAILAAAMMLLAFLSLACGLILDTVTHARREMKRMWYLSVARHARR